MDIAVLSDIHGNYIALQRCMEYAREHNITRYLFLGDYLGELAYPQRTMEMIYKVTDEYECYFVRGNKEEYWLDYRGTKKKTWRDQDSTTGSLLYTYKHLTERDLKFFENMPIAQTIPFNGMPQITICHGSPYKVSEKFLSNQSRTYEILDSIDSSLLICGHTHIQHEMDCNGKKVWNAGSVGVPLQSNGASQFLIVHGMDGQWVPEFVSLSYDVEKVIDELYEDKLDVHAPHWHCVTEHLLRKGNVSHGSVLAKAMTLCSQDVGSCIWPDIPEKYWEQAVEEVIGKGRSSHENA